MSGEDWTSVSDSYRFSFTNLDEMYLRWCASFADGHGGSTSDRYGSSRATPEWDEDDYGGDDRDYGDDEGID